MEQTVFQSPPGSMPGVGTGGALLTPDTSECTTLPALMRSFYSTTRIAQAYVRRSARRLNNWSPWSKAPSIDAETIIEQLVRKYGTNKHYTEYYYNNFLQTHKDHPLFDLYLESELGALNRSRFILESLCTTWKDIGFFHGKRCLDIGCSAGNSLIALTEFGSKEAIGLEVSQDRFNTALINVEGCSKAQKDRIKLLQMSILDESVVKKLGLFDVIFCLDVLEHVDDPELTIKNIKDLLSNNKDSFAFIQFANCLHYENIMYEPHYNIPGLVLLHQSQAIEYYNACREDTRVNYEVTRWLTLTEFEELCKKNGLSCEYYVDIGNQEHIINKIEGKLPSVKNCIEKYLSTKNLHRPLELLVYQTVDEYIKNVSQEIADFRVCQSPENLYRFSLKYYVRNYNFIVRARA
jgi:2-polyprenyl-3-methyl-5-hydroxy-6-metoxy-1,4-benzoquinol methylase